MKTIDLMAALVAHIKLHGDTLVFLGAPEGKVHPRDIEIECTSTSDGGCLLVLR